MVDNTDTDSPTGNTEPHSTTMPTENTLPSNLTYFVKNLNNFVRIQLDGTNYTLWESQVRNGLVASNLIQYVDGTYPCPPLQIKTPDGASITNPNYKTWTISPSLQSNILNLSHFYQIWAYLQQRFKTYSQTHIHNLKHDLHNLAKTSTETITTYLNRAKELTDKLSFAGVTVTDDDLVFLVLEGLPPQEYKAFKTTIRNRPDASQITMELLTPLIISEELTQTRESKTINPPNSDQNIAFVTQQTPNNNQTNQNFNGVYAANQWRGRGH